MELMAAILFVFIMMLQKQLPTQQMLQQMELLVLLELILR